MILCSLLSQSYICKVKGTDFTQNVSKQVRVGMYNMYIHIFSFSSLLTFFLYKSKWKHEKVPFAGKKKRLLRFYHDDDRVCVVVP